VASLMDGRELWAAAGVSVTGYHPCQARCAACPGWRPDPHHGPARQAFTAALRDATSHAIRHQPAHVNAAA
jgi:hypothetical protein